MVYSSWKSFVLSEAQTHSPGRNTPMFWAECYTTQLSRRPNHGRGYYMAEVDFSRLFIVMMFEKIEKEADNVPSKDGSRQR